MKKNVWVTLITFITLSFGYPLNSYSDIITKDGVKIQFFRKGVKKSISKKELSNPEGITSEDYNLLDRIVFSEGNQNWGSIKYTVKIINTSSNELLLMKQSIETYYEMKNTYSLPIYPWIDKISTYQGEISPSEFYILGEYSIIIEKVENNKNEVIFTLPYSIIENIY